ncbi:MAG: hypothetical protein JRH20_03815 [Deltaproteobacteria bacterium]|nr:hypothetical protein [Deltaproteobacteria bacterium]
MRRVVLMVCTALPACESLEVTQLFFQGHVTKAAALAEKNAWFLETPAWAPGIGHGLMALALCERCAEVWAVVQAWKNRAQNTPEKYQMLLRVEAMLATHAQRHAHALELLNDAYALCDEFHGDEVSEQLARAFTEPALVVAQARMGDLEGAHAVIDGWPGEERLLTEPLDGERNLARMRVALLEERLADVRRYAQRAQGLAETKANVPLLCEVQFCCVLAAELTHYADELAVFRALVHHTQIPLYVRRLQLLQQLVKEGRTPSTTHVIIRQRYASEQLSLMRLWTPRIQDLKSTIYFDRVQGMLYLAGIGPFFVRDQLIFRLLESILARRLFVVDIPQLYTEVWGTEYRHVDHEGKFHVTVHRLRAWLDEHGPDNCRSMVHVQDCMASLCEEAEVRVVEVEGPGGGRVREQSLGERVVDLLSTCSPASPRELEGQLGVSRSTLNEAIRCLLEAGRVKRRGRGPATRYLV